MVNFVTLVGRLAKTPELKVTESGKTITTIVLAVSRNFKNINGEYETDFIDCTIFSSVAGNSIKNSKVGDVVGIKGRIQTRIVELEDGTIEKKTEVVAERVTLLGNRKESEDGRN